MNKNNKKWSIISSLILVSVLASSIGIGAIIGITTKDDNYIKFYVEGEEFKPESNELTIGNNSTSDQDKALMIQAQFLTYAIFGTTDIHNVTNADANGINLLAKDQTWNTSYQVEREEQSLPIKQTILDTFVKMKFFNDTQYSSVIAYLYERMDTSTNSALLLKITEQIISYSLTEGIDPMQITGMKVINKINESSDGDEIAKFGENLFTTLINDYSYQVEVLMNIYTYIYLWQAPIESNTYDYMLTKELAYSKPSITWSMTYDAVKFGDNADQGVIDFMTAIKAYTNVSSYLEIGNSDWNTVYKTMYDEGYLVDPSSYDNKLSMEKTNQYRGFKGVTFGTSAGSGIDSSWNDSENIWEYQKSDEGVGPVTETINVSGVNRLDIMNDVNIYVPKDSKTNEGGIISGVIEDPTEDQYLLPSGENSIYLYNQLTPYIFKTSTINDGNDDEFGVAKFSLFANNKDGSFTPSNSGILPNDDNDVVYLFDDWFKDNSLMGEIYIVESLLHHNSSLEINATNYWQEEGFYIELSGKYEEDLLGFIPADMIKE